MAPLTIKSFDLLKKRIQELKNKNNYKFVVFADSWPAWDEKSKAKAIKRYQVFKGCLREAAKQKPLFIVINGDLVFSGTKKELSFYHGVVSKWMDKYKIPIFFTPGNHERNGLQGSLENYLNFVAPTDNYFVDVPNLRVILLNNIGPTSSIPTKEYWKFYGFNHNHSYDAFLSFLKGAMEKKVVVAMHVPPRTGRWSKKGERDTFDVDKGDNKKFMETLKKNKKVIEEVLVSHIHTYQTDTINGIHYTLTGQGGAALNGKYSIASFSVEKGKVSKPKRVSVKPTNEKPSETFIGFKNI